MAEKLDATLHAPYLDHRFLAVSPSQVVDIVEYRIKTAVLLSTHP